MSRESVSTYARKFQPAIPIPAAGAAARHVLFMIDQINGLDGGAEHSLLRTTRLLSPERYRATVVTFRTKPARVDLREFPCPVHVFPLDNSYGWNALKVWAKVWRLIRDEHVDLVQTFFETSDTFGALVAKLSGRPVVSSRRDMGFQRQPKHRFAYKLLGGMIDRVHTVSEAVREYAVREDRLDPAKVIAIPNGVDMEKIGKPRNTKHLRASYGLADASHIIVDVGSIRRAKGMDVLIETAALVCREFPKAVFLVVGHVNDAEHFRALLEMVETLGLRENVRFIGHSKDVYPLLKMCDVFCHLSRTDGLSNALLEAMACGLPCVISRAGGNPEVVAESESGFVVPIGDSALAAERVLAVLRCPEYARRMGDRGREMIEERYTAEVMVERLMEVYDGLFQ